MTYSRPGRISYVANDGATPGTLNHNQPAVLGGQPGIAIKQRYAGSSVLSLAERNLIAVDEKCVLLQSGVVEITYTDSTAVGTALYIKSAPTVASGARTYAVSATNDGTTVPFGVVVENPASGRGVPTGKVRVNLSLRDTETNA